MPQALTPMAVKLWAVMLPEAMPQALTPMAV
jgi:hypothetical protein